MNLKIQGLNLSYHGFAMDRVTAFFLFLLHVGAIASLFFFSWKLLIVTVAFWYFVGSFGIIISYHRMLTHPGIKMVKCFEYFFTIVACLPCQKGPLSWVSKHRHHHAKTEEVAEPRQLGDPHTPRYSKFWAYMGWILFPDRALFTPEFKAHYIPDLLKDKGHVLIDRFALAPPILYGATMFWLGGWPLLGYGLVLPVTICLHTTWSVNLFAHGWGSRAFSTKDDSTNNWIVALLTWGEGWHNNHHYDPTNPRHGLKWNQIDISWYNIKLLRFLRIIRWIYQPARRA